MTDFKTLYAITGDIKDVNTLLVPLASLRRGYMCLIDFDCELGYASGGNRIFPDPEDLKGHESCGIVKVGVLCLKVVTEPAPYAEDATPLQITEEPRNG